MNIPSLYDILGVTGFLADSIFVGLKIFVPVLLVLQVFNLGFRNLNFRTLALSLNILLLISGILFLLTIGVNACFAWFSGNEFEKEIIISVATGPTWFQFMIPFFIYGVVPHFLWIPKFRRTIYSTGIIVVMWFAAYFITAWLSHVKSSFNILTIEYVEKAALFILMLVVSYFFIDRKIKAKDIV
jgi:molybdopterin-containing oxidoreductase family membrane subunit